MSADKPIQITDIVKFNPQRLISKGKISPFVDMAALPTNSRDISEISEREFNGGGSKFKNGDTLFARITPCLENGKTAKVAGLSHNEIAHGSTEFIVMSAIEPSFDEDFVYYLARLPEFRLFAQTHMEGTSGRQRVGWQSLTQFPFSFPEKEKRKEIGYLLKKFDDKIELNRQTNQTLEQIAQALFKSWFVDFEPTRAKIAAKAAGATAQEIEQAAMRAISGKTQQAINQLPQTTQQTLKATANLFPEAMEESELGEIPQGWGNSTLGKHFNIVMGQSPDGETYNELGNGMVFFQGRRDFGFRFPIARIYTTAPKRVAEVGDTLISVRAPVGDKNMAKEKCCLGRGVASIRHKNGSRSFTYAFISFIESKLANSGSDGTVFSSINQNELKAVPYISPPIELIDIYENKIFSIDEKIAILSNEIETLENLRDSLLPKLLSGELGTIGSN